MNWPNRLTILRILLVVPFAVLLSWAILSAGNYSYIDINLKTILFIVSGILFLLAMITDYVDGFLARKYQHISSFGKFFDPIADKIMTSGALIILTAGGIVPFYLTIIFILRDILIDGFRYLAATKNLRINVSILGKLKTLLMSFSIVFIFLIFPFKNFSNNLDIFLINIPLAMAAILSIVSAYQYFKFILPTFLQEQK